MAEYDLDFKDFSLSEQEMKPKRFKIGADIFEAPPLLAPVVMAELTGLAAKFGGLAGTEQETPATPEALMEVVEAFGDVFEKLLTAETGPRFKQRLLSKDEPIDLMRQAVPALKWLIEVYGLRPIGPSSSSSDGSDGGGPGSTDGAPNGESAP